MSSFTKGEDCTTLPVLQVRQNVKWFHIMRMQDPGGRLDYDSFGPRDSPEKTREMKDTAKGGRGPAPSQLCICGRLLRPPTISSPRSFLTWGQETLLQQVFTQHQPCAQQDPRCGKASQIPENASPSHHHHHSKSLQRQEQKVTVLYQAEPAEVGHSPFS